jgi:hypothetical protein
VLKVVDSELLSTFRPCIDVVSCPGDGVSLDLLSFVGPEDKWVFGMVVSSTDFNREGFEGCLSVGC